MGEFYKNELEGKIKDYNIIDELIEKQIDKLIYNNENIVIEGRTVEIIADKHNSKTDDINKTSIMLDVDLENQINRYIERENITSKSAAEENIAKKDNFDEYRLFKKYGTNIFDKNNYNIVIDTSDLNINEVLDIILQNTKNY